MFGKGDGAGGRGGGQRGTEGLDEGGALKLVLLARNLVLNSDVVPNNKYTFGSHRGPLPHL